MAFAAGVALFFLKFAVYSAWCLVGIKYVRRERPRVRNGVALGAIRMFIGIAAGGAFLLLLTMAAPQQNRLGTSLPLMVGGFVVLRWAEWAVIGAFLAARRWNPAALFGRDARQHLWSALGVVVSFATDAGTLLGAGVAGLIPC
jgi:hypothetical protein